MLSLSSGESSLVLAPDIGGSIVGWTLGATPLLRRPLPDALIGGISRGLACFPLVPFSNRIANGTFEWKGMKYRLDRNFGDHPHTIHGVGWQAPWTVAAAAAASATLTLLHEPQGDSSHHWPFSFAAEQHFALTAEALRVRLAVQNLHDAPAPAGLGLHPYFPCTGAPSLRFSAAEAWINGADMLPLRRQPVPTEWDHSGGRKVGTTSLDNCFVGWEGEARITWPTHTLAITADSVFRHLVVYTPPGEDFCCVEPVSHMSDAINRMAEVPDHGLRILAPGEVLEGEVTFRVATTT